MTRHNESTGRGRREFLKVAGGFATTFVATTDALEGARPYVVHAPSGPNSALRLWPPVEASRTG